MASFLGAAFAVAGLCVKLHQQYDLVKRFQKDCTKLNELVLGVEKVLHTAAESGADMTTKQWSHALEALTGPLEEVGEVFAACQKTGILASLLNGKELNMRLDRVNSRLMLALQQLQVADLKEQVQTAQYASSRAAAQQSEHLERMLQSIFEQQQQQQREMKEQHNMLQAQNQQLEQQLQQQQQAFMLQLANLMQSAAPVQQQQQAGPGRQPAVPAAMNTKQLEAELADLQSCLQAAQHQHQPQQEQYLKQTIQFVERIQHHHKTKTLHLAFGDLPAQLQQQRQAQQQQPQQQQPQQQQPAGRTDSSRHAVSPLGYSSLQRSSTGASSRSNSGVGPTSYPLAGFGPPVPLAVPVVNSAAPVVPSVKQRVQVLEETSRTPAASRASLAGESVKQQNGAQAGVQLVAEGRRASAGQQLAGMQKTGQPPAPLLPGSMIWDGPVVPTVRRTSSIMSNGSNGSSMNGSMAVQDAGDKGNSIRMGNGTFSSTAGTSSSVPLVLFETFSGDSEDVLRSSSAACLSSPRGVMQPVPAVPRSYSSRSASETLPCQHWDVRSPDQAATTASVATAVKGPSTADVGGSRHWQVALAAAKGKPEAAEAWRLLGFALRDQQKVDLSCQGLTDKDVQALSLYAAPFWTHATAVSLSHNRISAVGVAALAQHAAQHWKHLMHLDLSGNSIGPEGAASLASQAAQHWNQLQHLLLNSTAVGNTGAQALAQHGAAHWPGLVVLSLQDNGINSRGAAALAEPSTLSRWRQMQRLDLRGNSISRECADILHMAAAKMWDRPGTILV